MRLIEMKVNNVQTMGALALLAGTKTDLLDLFVGNETRKDAGNRLRDLTIDTLEYYADNKACDRLEDAGAVIATGITKLLEICMKDHPDIIRDSLMVLIKTMTEVANSVVEGPKNARS